MKPITILLLSLLLLAVDLDGRHETLAAQVDRSGIEHDTLRTREDRREYRREREEWIAAMHRAAPGVQVALINEGIRRAKRMLHDQQRADRGNRGAADRTVDLGGGLRGSWQERGSRNQAGRTHAADVDWVGEKVYVAADGGQIWRGSLDGVGWTSLNDRTAFRNVRLLETVRDGDRLRLIVVGNNYARTTESEGEEWDEATGLGEIARWGGFVRAVMSRRERPTIYAIGTEWDYDEWEEIGVLYRSTDLGTSFVRSAVFAETRLLDLWSPPGEESAWVVVGDTLGRIGPEGELEIVTPAIRLEGGSGGVRSLNLRGGTGGLLVLYVNRNGLFEIQISGDSGLTWSRTGEVPTSLFTRNSFEVDPLRPERMVAGGIEAFVSEDAGYTWRKINNWGAYYARPESRLHADIPFIRYDYGPAGERTLLISTDGGLYRSEDDAASVRNISLAGLGNAQYYSVWTSRVDTTVIFAGAQDQGFQRSRGGRDGMLDFEQTISGDYGHISSGDGGRSVWTNYPGFSMYYPNAGEELIGSNAREDFPTTGHLWLPPLVVDPDTPSVAWVAGGETPEFRGARLIRMGFDPAEGKIIPSIHPFDFSRGTAGVKLCALAISPVDHDRWYVLTTANRLWVSTDRGRSWSERGEWSAPGGHYFYGTALLPSKSDPETLWIAGSGYSSPGVWVSHDNGRTFDSISAGLPPTLVYDIDASIDGSLLFAATAVGPYLYHADSNRWYDAAGRLAPDQTWWSVDYIEENRVARFGTYGRGIWDLRLDDAPGSDVRSTPAPSAPALTLEARHRGERIELVVTAERSGEGRLEVYDLQGRRVAILHAGPIPRGTTHHSWNRHATGGAPLPSGRYFCLLLSNGSVAFDQIEL